MIFRVNDIRVRFLVGMFVCQLLLLCSSGNATAQTITSGEYNIKAVFIYNFTRFVEWPKSAFVNENAPFKIAVLGPDPFAGKLESVVKGELVNGHPIVIERFNSWNEVRACHILYVSSAYAGDWKSHLEGIKNNPTLTVSDKRDFAHRGGMIRFDTQDNKIKLIINPSAARASALSISSKLLRLAEIVEGD